MCIYSIKMITQYSDVIIISRISPKLLYYLLQRFTRILEAGKIILIITQISPKDFFLYKLGRKHTQGIEIPALVTTILIKIAPQVIPGVELKKYCLVFYPKNRVHRQFFKCLPLFCIIIEITTFTKLLPFLRVPKK